jgi:mono/diheme cytochrome c family protein
MTRVLSASAMPIVAACTARLVPAVIAAVLLCLPPGPAHAAGDAQAGGQLAQRWCTGCHIVDGSGKGPDTAPPFAVIARRSPNDRGWLRAWLTAPHPPMPDPNLNRRQIDDVIAYLDSLTPR